MKAQIKIASTLSTLIFSMSVLAQDIPFAGKVENEPGWNDKSNGYRHGKIVDVQEHSWGPNLGGLNPLTSCEVKMNVGELSDAVYARRTTEKNGSNESTMTYFQLLSKTDAEKIQKLDNDETDGTDIIRVNPWSFNVDRELCPRFKSLVGNEVVVHYHQPFRRMGLQDPSTTTTYRYLNMFPVNNKKAFKPFYAEVTAGYIDEMKSRKSSCPFFSTTCSGVMEGKILKISYKGKWLNTWEVQVVQGGSQGRVMTFSMPDKARHVARWAVLSMVAGYDVRFYFETVTEGFLKKLNTDSYFKDTNRLIYAMELMPKTIEDENVVAEKVVPNEVLMDENRQFHLDDYIWNSFVDIKRGKLSLREFEQKARREERVKYLDENLKLK